MSEGIFVILVMVEAGLGAVAIVALGLSLILFYTNRKRDKFGGINTVAGKRAPIICLGIALPCFLLMPIIYKGLRPETFPYWNEYAGNHMDCDAVVEYQGEEYVRLDMVIDTSRLKTSECKGYIRIMGDGKPSAGTRGRWTGNAVYEIENETGFPLLCVERPERVDGTDIYHADLYCRKQDKSDFLAACFEGDNTKTIYLIYQEDEQGALVDKGYCLPKQEMGMTMDLWNYLYSLEERETEYINSSEEKKPDYFLDAYFMNGLFSRRFHLDYDTGQWYCFMDDEQGHHKEQIIELPKKGQKYMNNLAKQ